jgi:hypothetical protein
MRHRHSAGAASTLMERRRRKPGRALRIAALAAADLGRRSRELRLGRSAPEPTPGSLASTECDDGDGYFLSACRVALKKVRRPLPGISDAIRIAENVHLQTLGSGTQKPVPRLRKSMQKHSAATQAGKCLSLCIRCATPKIVVQIQRKTGAIFEPLSGTSEIVMTRWL